MCADSDLGEQETVGSCLCSGLAATFLEVCSDGQLVLQDATADRAAAAAALRCLLAFSPDGKVLLHTNQISGFNIRLHGNDVRFSRNLFSYSSLYNGFYTRVYQQADVQHFQASGD